MKLTRQATIAGLQLLNQILGTTELAPKIQSMKPQELYYLISKIGLDDCGAVIALTNPDQLFAVLDVDLWRSVKPGQEEQFDPARFSMWLEILFTMGTIKAAEKLVELNRSVVIMALSTQIMVVDESWSPEDEKVTEGSLYHEFERYLVVAREDWSWDALLGILAEIQDHFPDDFQEIMDQLVQLSRGDGSHGSDGSAFLDLLSITEQLQSDVTEERNERRENAGFITPVQAAQFLNVTRSYLPADLHRIPLDDMTRLYFKRLYDSTSQNKIAETGFEEEPAQLRLLLKGKIEETNMPVCEALASLAGYDQEMYNMRLQEALYLSNILLAGCSFQSKPFQSTEAVQAVTMVTNLGLDYWQNTVKSKPELPAKWLADHNMITLFKMGWSLLHHKVSMQFASDLAHALDKPKNWPIPTKGKIWLENQVKKMKDQLHTVIKEEQPWKITDQLPLLNTILEGKQVATIIALMQEFPLWAVSTSPENESSTIGWIYELKQLKDIADFGQSLPSLFSH